MDHESTHVSTQPVLILGAGVNGCAAARELLLNGIPVWMVEENDIGWGATSRSSRLIHGGLRYLEYGDFRLVHESLDERERLRRLAPQFVEPLRLHIPVRHRVKGFVAASLRFFGIGRSRATAWLGGMVSGQSERGMWLVRMGLWLYDVLARSREFPKHRLYRVGDPGVPQIDANRFRWLCAYSDAQMLYPERFLIALLRDARQLAQEKGIEFRLWTYHRVERSGARINVLPCDGGTSVAGTQPCLIINATGAWGDLTLKRLNVASERLFGGTKGSHFVTHSQSLRAALGDNGLYAESADGRMVFVLPFGAAVLVGTTDEHFEGVPDQAVASQGELDYLIGLVNELFPGVGLAPADVAMHYSGVRPLPNSSAARTSAISRDHSIEVNTSTEIPVMTLVGGKLTTARAFGELVCEAVCNRRHVTRRDSTRDRPIPGGKDYPQSPDQLAAQQQRLAGRFALSADAVKEMWQLCGTLTETALAESGSLSGETLTPTALPRAFVSWVIDNEWVTTLSDLVERRLMLLYRPGISRGTLNQLAQCLVEAGRLDAEHVDRAVRDEIARLKAYYGKSITE